MLRKFFLVAVLLLMIFSLSACSGNETEPSVTEPPNNNNNADNNKNNPDDSGDGGENKADLKNLTSLEFARLLGHGINLGNTMEACDSDNRIPNRETSVYETMWGQPITTQAIIDGMKEAGFTTLRIPVAWTNAMDFENGDFKIGEAYLDRVAEIIDYALNADMFVVVNAHWDHGWWSMFGHAEAEKRELAMTIFTEMWTQIAERYSDFDHRLVLEAANEEMGNRFNDKQAPFSDAEGILSRDECYELLTELTQIFVDIVRESGGNNAERFLLIPGYNTDVVMTMDDRFEMPNDPANKLLLSVHYYTPWGYCGDTASLYQWGTTQDVEEMNELLGMLTKYTDMGYGIVMGEWGVLDNDGDDRLTFFTNFLDNCDLYGYSSLLWDIGFLYDRQNAVVSAPEIAELFLARSAEARASMTVEEIIDAAKASMALTLEKAAVRPEFVLEADEAFAWIMFNSGNWALEHSVGDRFNPENKTPGIEVVNPEITGAGSYEASLDFTGTAAGFADGIGFSALGLANGEILFPGYFIEITEILINGEPAEFSGKPYTTSDDKICTRVNLYNRWVNNIPDEARVSDGDLTDATWSPLLDYIGVEIETLVVRFDYIAP